MSGILCRLVGVCNQPMAPPIKIVGSYNSEGIDTIIDVRSPSEFNIDHIPNAINLPVLSDREHAIVGRMHQHSHFDARKIGAAFVAANMSAHLNGPLRDKSNDFTPLIYCARGGQRSKAFALICAEIGWRCRVLEGGYKSYRRDLLSSLDAFSTQFKIIKIAGRTGTGKTEIIGALLKQGKNVIDLENLAHHRGSLLGAHPTEEQPSQKLFETLLWAHLKTLQPDQPVFVEAESSKIGNIQIPHALWRAMKEAPQVMILSKRHNRVRYLLDNYTEIQQNSQILEPLFKNFEQSGQTNLAQLCKYELRKGNWESLAELLLQSHYDKKYDRSIGYHGCDNILALELDELNDNHFRQAAKKISETCLP